MGATNADKIRACEKARRLYGENSQEYAKAAFDVAQSQKDCPHPFEQRWVKRSDVTSRSGKYKAGQPLVFCCLCSKILEKT